jgi:hypothetical protein
MLLLTSKFYKAYQDKSYLHNSYGALYIYFCFDNGPELAMHEQMNLLNGKIEEYKKEPSERKVYCISLVNILHHFFQKLFG